MSQVGRVSEDESPSQSWPPLHTLCLLRGSAQPYQEPVIPDTAERGVRPSGHCHAHLSSFSEQALLDGKHMMHTRGEWRPHCFVVPQCVHLVSWVSLF